MFEQLTETSSEAIQTTQEYIQSSQKYLKLKTFEQLSLSFSTLIRIMAIGSFVMIAFSFIAIASALAMSDYLGSPVYGFLVVAGIFLLLALVVYWMRNKITDAVISSLSNQFFSDNE